jgi:CheY-like chemotaxis protein
VLNAVAAMLAQNHDVAAVASNGRQVLALAAEVNPDVIVLDISMPELDGFQTFDALERAGSRTPVVFLSMHEASEYVAAAFQRGGRGYVVKSRLTRDLPSAIEQALMARLFVPSLSSLFQVAEGRGHAMQIHGEVDPFLNGAATFLDQALRRGDATCVISTERIREGLAHRLRARGWNVGDRSGNRRYLVFDADETLNRIMRNGVPDLDRLAKMVGEIDQYRLAEAIGETPRLTIFGTMVVQLWAAGNATAALAIERAWGTLVRDLPFLTLCGYPNSCFHESAPDLWTDLRTAHMMLSHASDV